MKKTIAVNVVDSHGEIYSGLAEHVIAPAVTGEIGIYPNHAPLLTKLKIGVLRLQLPDQARQLVLVVNGGFLEVKANEIVVLADVVERTEELDEARLQEQKVEAMARINYINPSIAGDAQKAKDMLALVVAQLQALEYIKQHPESH